MRPSAHSFFLQPRKTSEENKHFTEYLNSATCLVACTDIGPT